MTISRFDVVRMEKAVVTPEGWIKDTPIVTRAGVFEYRRADGTIRREFRPPEEVFHPETLASMAGIPVTDSHRDLFHKDNDDGIIGSSLGEGKRQDEADPKNYNVIMPLVIHRPKAMKGNREISLGYTLQRLDETPGEWEGQKYDAVQRGIRMNHAAIIPKGRAGVSRLRLDAADAVTGMSEEDFMAEKLVPVRLDNIEYQASPEVLNALTKAQGALADAQRRADTAEAERDGLKEKLTAAEANVVKARADGVEQARGRLVLEEKAKGLGVEVKDTDTDRAIREAVVRKVRGDAVDFTGKSDDYVQARFDDVLDGIKSTDKNAQQQRQQTTGAPAPGTPPVRQDAAPKAGGARAARDRLHSNPSAAYGA